MEVLTAACCARSELDRIQLRSGHDSRLVACWHTRGVDADRTEIILHHDGSSLAVLLESDGPWCVARPPGYISIVTVGPAPVVDVTALATPKDAEKAGVEWTSGGCRATVATRRHTFDPAKRKSTPAGAPRHGIAEKLCKCLTPR
ncbi:MAG: hypothetical protein KF773_38080 [Deltaproteobacteria bacterium]|nr:hypothetical protein [Deltaproteobacteria bacterium]